MNTARKCALVYVARSMSQGLCCLGTFKLHDVIGGHQTPIDRKIDGIMGHPVLQLAKTTLGSRAAHDIINMNI